MYAEINLGEHRYQANINAPIDISIPLTTDYPQVNCFHAPLFAATPVRMGDWVGSTAHGSPVNFFNVAINPHGNGTHTECVGHIARESHFINQCFVPRMYTAQLVSIFPQLEDHGDRIITARHLENMWDWAGEEALIVRTLPNEEGKCTRNYSGTNPPYFTKDAMDLIVARGIRHLLTDLPSVDREEDGGALAAHRAFWQYPGQDVRKDCTITELIFVPDHVYDGIYLLNLQLLNMALDASPSRPLLYKLE